MAGTPLPAGPDVTNTMRIVLLGLLGMLTGCGSHGSGRSSKSTSGEPRAASEPVLVFRTLPTGQVEQAWQPARPWSRELNDPRVRALVRPGSVVFVSHRSRDCDQEQIECHRDCMRRKPPYPHGARLGYGHVSYCDNTCLNAYMACLKTQRSSPVRFHSLDALAEWLRRHQEELVVGGIVVVAGLSFVVISAGTGLLVLAPLVLLS